MHSHFSEFNDNAETLSHFTLDNGACVKTKLRQNLKVTTFWSAFLGSLLQMTMMYRLGKATESAVHNLVLVFPPPPLIKVASNTRPCSQLGGTTLNGREEGGQYYISQTCDKERFEARKSLFLGTVSTFLQLVVAHSFISLSQNVPVQPGLQKHRNSMRRSRHTASFWQGRELHSLIKSSQRSLVKRNKSRTA